MPNKLLEIRVEERIRGAMHSTEFAFAVPPCSFDSVCVHRGIIGVDEIQRMVDGDMILELIIGLPLVSDYSCSRQNMVVDDWEKSSCCTVWNCNHEAMTTATFHTS